MKLRTLIIALGLAGLMSACDQTPKTESESATETQAGSTAARDDSPVVAEVNGAPITRAELDLYMKQRQARRPGGEEEEAVLNELINLELARQQGERQDLDEDREIAMQIEQQRRAVIASAAIQRYLEEHPVTDEEMKKVYDDNVGSGEEYKARHILVEEKEAAEKIIAELDQGADFSELAEKHSKDSSGDLGWFSPKQMVQPFSDAVAKLEKGSYTREPVQTQFGWHVIMLDDSRQSTPPDFEMLKPQIMAMMQNQRVQQYIESLREGANVNIVADVGGESAEQGMAQPEEAPAQPEQAPAQDAGETGEAAPSAGEEPAEEATGSETPPAQ